MQYLVKWEDLIASEETILPLIKTKCVPMLLHGLEVCPLKQRDIRSLDFCVNRFLMKLFRTSDINVVEVCRDMFNFDLPSTTRSQPYKEIYGHICHLVIHCIIFFLS